MADKEDYTVGYRKPPVESRFQKGKSGNPRGRPKGSVSLVEALEEELSQRVTVTENGKSRTLSKGSVAVKALVNKALKGDIRAFREMIALQSKAAKPEENPWADGSMVIELDLGERRLKPPQEDED